MAISSIGGNDYAAAGTGSATLSLVTATSGDLILIMGVADGSGAYGTVTQSGWTQLFAVQNAANNITFSLSYKISDGTETSATVNKSDGSRSQRVVWHHHIFRGVNTSNPFDATYVTATGSAGGPNSPSITTVTDGAYVISCGGTDVADAFSTKPTGYSNNFTEAYGDVTCVFANKAISPAGAENPSSWTDFTDGNWVAASVALRPQAAGTFGDGVLSGTGTGTATFKPASQFLIPCSVSVAFVGQPISSNPAPFTMTGAATATFVCFAANDGAMAFTATGTASFVGAKEYMSSVREVIESRGAASVTVH